PARMGEKIPSEDPAVLSMQDIRHWASQHVDKNQGQYAETLVEAFRNLKLFSMIAWQILALTTHDDMELGGNLPEAATKLAADLRKVNIDFSQGQDRKALDSLVNLVGYLPAWDRRLAELIKA